MARRKEAHGGGHGWFVTFADLMGLLVSFFVMLVAFSNQDQQKLQIVAGSMRDAFGTQNSVRYSGIIEVDGLPTEIRPNLGIFTQPITLSGCPVVSVPVVVRGALPLGVQLIGRAGSESLLLAVAEQLEAQGAVGAGAVPVVA